MLDSFQGSPTTLLYSKDPAESMLGSRLDVLTAVSLEFSTACFLFAPSSVVKFTNFANTHVVLATPEHHMSPNCLAHLRISLFHPDWSC